MGCELQRPPGSFQKLGLQGGGCSLKVSVAGFGAFTDFYLFLFLL